MLKLLLFIVIAGALIYLLFKLFLYLYRPFFLAKTFRKIDQMYNRLLTNADKTIDEWIEGLEAWRSDEVAARIAYHSEDELIKNLNDAKEDKTHEEEVYGKFLRCRERFVYDPEKLSESIVTYQRYLNVRLKQIVDAPMIAKALEIQVMSFDEMLSQQNETMIVLEESERKLDMLLT